ncbi:unnamed protein product [Brachionus calyciflorus]|uniref:MULE transposase domain-containing protein n=1 Tax=Brachionus calyciflorus TaxID=104777 RepID=A0A814FQY6_9BILA|nr:unnamed protein product [Brachionus calyciflorus]
MAFLNASSVVFDKVPLFGCYFHFKQNMWRKILELGLKPIYTENEEVRNLLKLPQALALIPANDVLHGFNLIKSKVTDSKILEFYEYIEDIYFGKNMIEKVGRGRGRKEVLVFKEPLFSVSLWNVNSRVVDCLPRTNFVESWHNAFSNKLIKHPLVCSLVDSFIKEQKKADSDLIKIKTGLVNKRRPKYRLLDNRIKVILSNYSINNIEETMKNLCLIF